MIGENGTKFARLRSDKVSFDKIAAYDLQGITDIPDSHIFWISATNIEDSVTPLTTSRESDIGLHPKH